LNYKLQNCAVMNTTATDNGTVIIQTLHYIYAIIFHKINKNFTDWIQQLICYVQQMTNTAKWIHSTIKKLFIFNYLCTQTIRNCQLIVKYYFKIKHSYTTSGFSKAGAFFFALRNRLISAIGFRFRPRANRRRTRQVKSGISCSLQI